MRITISGAKSTPKWETLQAAIRQTIGDDEQGVITRIARTDRHCGYRDPGTYRLTFVPDSGDAIEVELDVYAPDNESDQHAFEPDETDRLYCGVCGASETDHQV